MHLYKHLKYRGAKPRGEVAKPKTELAHRGRLINVASDLYIHLHIYIYIHTYIATHGYIDLRILTYTYIYLHIPTYTYICVRILTYTSYA